MSLRKPSSNGEACSGVAVSAEGAIWAKRPVLAEFMTEACYEGGDLRVRPTLMAFVADGLWQLWLHDREEARSAFVTGRTLDEALGVLESGLKGDGLCWRKDGAKRR
jgi:hypothetical protein